MQRCIELARLGAGQVAPNPMVGSVLVRDGLIIGEGYHEKYGQAHAEVNCISQATLNLRKRGLSEAEVDESFRQSTIYVSLEPCAHFGKTPPCADLIISKKIPLVVVGCRDPFPLVDGKGIEKLERAGVGVITGILEEACVDLNKRFFTFHKEKRPWILLKWAQSNDRMIAATGDARTLISHATSNRLVHKWRSEAASILIGANTALLDDPSLTTRLWPGKSPVRLVVDPDLRLPPSLQVFNEAMQTMVFNTVRQEQQDGVLFYKIARHKSLPAQICEALYALQIQSVMVEGGRNTLQQFIDQCFWDETRVITNESLMLWKGLDAPCLAQASLAFSERIGPDRVDYFENTCTQ